MPPAPETQQVIRGLSPNLKDVLFWEIRDSNLPKNRRPEIYGQCHPNEEDYPDHVLVLIEPHDEEGKQKWYYANDRTDQEEHNWQVSYPFTKLDTTPIFETVAILRREGFEPITKGTIHPLATSTDVEHARFADAVLMDESQIPIQPAELSSIYIAVRRIYGHIPTYEEQEEYNFELDYPYWGLSDYPRILRTYVVARTDLAAFLSGAPASDPYNADSIFVGNRVRRSRDPKIDSLWVEVTRIYDVIPDYKDTDPGGGGDQLEELGWTVTRPYNTDDHVRLVWKIPVAQNNWTITTDYEACPITGYTDLELTDERYDASPDRPGQGVLVRTYDSLDGALGSTARQIRNPGIPAKFIDRQLETNEVQPVKNDATIEDTASTGGILAGPVVIESSLGPAGTNQLIHTKANKAVQLEVSSVGGEEIDMETGGLMPYTQEIVIAGTGGTIIQADGTYAEVSPLNTEWSVKTSRKATDLAGNSQTWTTTMSGFFWPAVLLSIDWYEVLKRHPKYGTTYTERYAVNANLSESYNGPCFAEHNVSWTSTAPTKDQITDPLTIDTPMAPTGAQVDMPLARFSIPRCLHPAVAFSINVNDPNHPVYPTSAITWNWPAASHATWPDTIKIKDEVIRYRGGFKRTKITLTKPYNVSSGVINGV